MIEPTIHLGLVVSVEEKQYVVIEDHLGFLLECKAPEHLPIEFGDFVQLQHCFPVTTNNGDLEIVARVDEREIDEEWKEYFYQSNLFAIISSMVKAGITQSNFPEKWTLNLSCKPVFVELEIIAHQIHNPVITNESMIGREPFLWNLFFPWRSLSDCLTERREYNSWSILIIKIPGIQQNGMINHVSFPLTTEHYLNQLAMEIDLINLIDFERLDALIPRYVDILKKYDHESIGRVQFTKGYFRYFLQNGGAIEVKLLWQGDEFADFSFESKEAELFEKLYQQAIS